MGRGPKRQLCSEQPSGTYRSVSQHCPSGILPETGKEPFRAAVITLSDKGAAGEREDKSDPLAEKLLTEAGYEV